MRSDGHRSITSLVPSDGSLSTDVFCEIGRLMKAWREDPARLAVAVVAYEGLGYTMSALEIQHGPDYPSETWSDERCHEAIDSALRGRPRRLLRAQARGLVMGLVATATDARRARLHDIQVEASVISCRKLSAEERVEAMRSKQP